MKRFASVLSVAAFLLAAAAFVMSLCRWLEDRGDWLCCDDDDCGCDCGCDDCVDSDVFEEAPASDSTEE